MIFRPIAKAQQSELDLERVFHEVRHARLRFSVGGLERDRQPCLTGTSPILCTTLLYVHFCIKLNKSSKKTKFEN